MTRTVREITSGEWLIDGTPVKVGDGLVVACSSEAVVEELPEGAYDEWTQANGSNWPMQGDIREFDGVEYVSQINFNVWAPTTYSRGWKRRDAAADGSWEPDVYVTAGTFLDHEGKRYVVNISHTTQEDWEPGIVLNLFSKVLDEVPGNVWQAGIQVTTDETYFYPDLNGTEWRVVQSHTTQAGWEPPNVPALWTEIV